MQRRAWILTGVGALGVLTGGLLGSWLRGPATPAPGRAPGGGEAAAVAALREDLAEERLAREALAGEVALLRGALVEWLAPDDPDARDAPAPAAPAPGSAAGAQAPPAAARAGPWFDEPGLREAGLAPAEIERLRGRFEEFQMEELYLRDQAVREGWRQRPRYPRELSDLRGELRRELGEESYDWMLYAMGQPNRVRLEDVLESSPAAQAGLEPGDLVLRYDDRRVFNARELQQATAQGRAGGSVAVDLVRGGAVVRVYLPRGPLGVRLKGLRLVPEAG